MITELILNMVFKKKLTFLMRVCIVVLVKIKFDIIQDNGYQGNYIRLCLSDILGCAVLYVRHMSDDIPA